MRDALTTRRRILDVAQDLVLKRGFSATTVDAVIEGAGISKGAFFHHFPSKGALGQSMLERYAAADADLLESFMAEAEATSDDPAVQVIQFVRAFEEASADLFSEPGCLFVSFVYERMPESREAHDVIRANIELWRKRLGAKLSAAMDQRSVAGDPDSIADHMFATFEGAFILARATNDPADVRRQLGHYRRYLELLLKVPTSGDPK